MAYEAAGNDAKAMSLWKESLSINPGESAAWIELASLTYRTTNKVQTRSVIEEGLKHNPDSARLNSLHGLVLSEFNETALATAAFNKAVKLDSDYSDVVAPYLESLSNQAGQRMAIVPLERGDEGQLYVRVILNDEIEAKLLVDSGASSTVINRALAHKLGLSLVDRPRVSFASVTGNDEAAEVILSSAKVNDLTARNVRCLVYDTAPSGTHQEDGILGMSFLSKFKFTIDPAIRQLILVLKVTT